LLFTEPTFLFFFLPLLLAGYSVLPPRLRNGLLAFASVGFYAWGEKEYVLVMIVSIGFNHLVGLGVRPERSAPSRRLFLYLGIAGNIVLLSAFKYADFVADNLSSLLLVPFGLPALHLGPIHLPIGISFFTFQSLSYVIDVYRGHARAQRSLLNTGLFVSLFPQLIAGPIVRYRELAEQLPHRTLNLRKFSRGVHCFIIGLGKKVIIANNVAWPADQIFALPADELTTPLAWTAITCYTLQIYFDFSGYSDMAVGLGWMFGFRIPRNFNYPYIARSVTDFWRRWHMTLSRWFRDYLYIPLGGNRGAPWRTYRNLVIVFVLCGLWHGASWAFVVWGLFHGVFLALERAGLGRILSRGPAALRHVYTMAVVMLGWVLFRAATGPPDRTAALEHSAAFAKTLVGLGSAEGGYHPIVEFMSPQGWLVLVIGMIGATPVYPYLRVTALRTGCRVGISRWGKVAVGVRLITVAYLFLVLAAGILILASNTYNPFIYFQF